MAAYTLNGIVKEVMDPQTFNSGFTKREFVVTTKDDRYPQDIKFEAVQEKVSIVDGLQAGDDVTVTFDLRGNEYNGRYFVNLRAWKLEKESAGGTAGNGDELPPLPTDIPEDVVNSEDEDLPF
jgi:hypothetical protein